MKKKSILISLLLLLAMLAGVVLWPAVPEYGDSYSEQQRKLWNERRALYPAAWNIMIGDVRPEYADAICTITPMRKEVLEHVLRRKREEDNALALQQEDLRDREKVPYPEMEVKLPDTESLRLDEISIRECLQRARGGDAEACMVMAWRMGGGGMVPELVWSWNRTRTIHYWLDKAESLGRPEAKFLKNCSSIYQKEIRKNLTRSMSGCSYTTPSGFDYTVLPGYGDFMECIRNGDALAYRMMRDIMFSASILPKERDILWNVLRERAKSGDLRAMEDLAAIAFEGGQIDEYSREIKREMKASLCSRIIKLLPEFARESVWHACVGMGVLDAEDTVAMRNFREAAEYARLGARRGSLACMSSWLGYGLNGLDYFSREDWEDVFRYSRLLVEHGYAPYICRLNVLICLDNYNGKILNYYYIDQKNWNERFARGQQLFQERVTGYDLSPLYVAKNAEDIEKQWDDAVAVYGADQVLSYLMMRTEEIRPELAGAYIEKVRQQADKGDPCAAFVQGYLLEQERLLHVDHGEAWRCYERALERVDPKDMTCVPNVANKRRSGNFLVMLPEAIRMAMLSLLLEHPEFPGRDLSRVPDLLHELEDFTKDDSSGSLCYLMGRVYEDGIGVPVDLSQALKYYERGKDDNSHCAERWEKLQASISAK